MEILEGQGRKLDVMNYFKFLRLCCWIEFVKSVLSIYEVSKYEVSELNIDTMLDSMPYEYLLIPGEGELFTFLCCPGLLNYTTS